MKHDLVKSPKSIYGKTKSEGEDLILKLGECMSVLRITKVVHKNLLIFKKWTELLRCGKEIQAYVDLYFCPIMLEDVTNTLMFIADRGVGGVYQVSGESDISYYEAAITLCNMLKVKHDLVQPFRSIDSGISEENILRYTSLDTSSLPVELKFMPPKPIDVLKKIYNNLL
jgi:dTDP-4-dehydrorhamnose reductase